MTHTAPAPHLVCRIAGSRALRGGDDAVQVLVGARRCRPASPRRAVAGARVEVDVRVRWTAGMPRVAVVQGVRWQGLPALRRPRWDLAR